MLRLGKLEQEVHALKLAPSLQNEHAGSEGAETAELEVAVYMGRIQLFMNKLWSSGNAGNLELAQFYRHELEESMEDLVNAGVVDDGVPVSEHMSEYGLKTMTSLDKKWKAEGLADFAADHAMLVNTCNTCHQRCGYGFIKIRSPSSSRFDDQDFTAAHKGR